MLFQLVPLSCCRISTSRDPSANIVLHSLSSGLWHFCNVYALKFSQCCLFFFFLRFLHHPLFSSHVSLCPHPYQMHVKLCLFGWHKVFQQNLFNTRVVWGLWEERPVDKGLGRKSAVWLLYWPAVWFEPCLNCWLPVTSVGMTKQGMSA